MRGVHAFIGAVPSAVIIAMAATCDDHTIRLWKTTEMKEAVLKGRTAAADAVVFSPDGTTLASGQADGLIRLWRRASRDAGAEERGRRPSEGRRRCPSTWSSGA
jgi:WD40 repeat protein